MKWPRGKGNGQRIVGFKVSFSIQLRPWFWSFVIPRVSWNFGEPYFIWTIFTLRFYAKYDHWSGTVEDQNLG